MALNKNRLDVSQILLTYVALVGDVQKTAAALDLDPEVVQQLADSEKWDLKIQRVTLMAKSGKPGDFERAQNRALAFVQGHRIRGLVDRVITRFSGMTEDEICKEITATGKNGIRHVSARFFTDLAAAAEKANALTFAALGDSISERMTRDDEPDQMNANALHAAVIQSLSAPGANTKAADQIVRELAQAVDTVVCQNDTPQPVVVQAQLDPKLLTTSAASERSRRERGPADPVAAPVPT